MEQCVTFGTWLRRRRKMLDLQQVELARRIGYSVSLVRKFEADRRRPSQQAAQRLADELEIPREQRDAFLHLALFGTPREETARSSLSAPPALPPPGNLLLPLTPIIGRDDALRTIMEQVLLGKRRLVTLVGPPGVGKTRLGLEVAAALAQHIDDGVYVVMLASVHDPAHVTSAIGRVLNVRMSAESSELAAITTWLRDRRVLVVLDNFEHVLTARTTVQTLLQACPLLRILVTSRHPLKLGGEQQIHVTPLDVPPPEVWADVAAVATAPATALFLERAAAVTPNMTIARDEAVLVARICTLLDGLPLAIELAAARCHLLTLTELLARLDRRLPLLTMGPHDLPQHQQTLRAAIDWSYHLLPLAAQRAFAQLSVFVGGWTLAAAEAVLATERTSGLDLLTTLVESSLVVRQPQPDGSARYMLLETLREYAGERLTDFGMEVVARERHAAALAQIAEAAAPSLRGPHAAITIQRLDADRSNLLAAIAWSFAHDGGHSAARVIASTRFFWHARIDYRLAPVWAALLDTEQRTPSVAPQLRAHALRVAAFLAAQGGGGSTIEFFEHSLALFRQVHDHYGIAETLYNLGMLARYPGNRARTAALLEESLMVARSSGDRLIEAHVLHQLGLLFWEHDELATAEQRLIAARVAYQEVGSRINTNRTELTLGQILLRRHAFRAAADAIAGVLTCARATGDRGVEAEALHALGAVAIRTGESTQAKIYYEESLTILEEAGHIPQTAVVHRDHGYLALKTGDLETARFCFLKCQELGSKYLALEVVAHSLTALAVIDAQHGQPERAARSCGAAQALRERFTLRPHDLDEALASQAASMLSTHLGVAAFTEYVATAAAMVREQFPRITFKSGWEAIQELNIAQVVANAVDPVVQQQTMNGPANNIEADDIVRRSPPHDQ